MEDRGRGRRRPDAATVTMARDRRRGDDDEGAPHRSRSLASASVLAMLAMLAAAFPTRCLGQSTQIA